MDHPNGTAPTGPILDIRVLADLRVELGPDAEVVIADILGSFREDTLAQFEKCRQATVAADLAKAAHRLRGSALNVGAVALSAICAKAEAAGNAGDLPAGQACLPAMADILSATVAALSQAKA